MELSIKQKWLSVAVVAVILPISLLAAFRLTGILPEPQTPETITVEPVNWSMDRPSDYIVFGVSTGWGNMVETNYADETVLVDICVYHSIFLVEYASSPFFGRDGFVFRAWVNTTALTGFVSSITVRFQTDNQSDKEISEQFLEIYNATVTGAKYWTTNSSKPVFVETEVSDSSASLKLMLEWVLSDDFERAHQALATAEILHFNGTSYRKIILPLQFDVIPDVGNSFETAQPLVAGEYLGCLDEQDFVDIYAVNLHKGQTVNVTMIPPQDANFDLHLYNVEGLQVADSTKSGNSTESTAFTANSTGDWYIKVLRVAFGWKGVYKFKIEVLEAKP